MEWFLQRNILADDTTTKGDNFHAKRLPFGGNLFP